MQRFVSSGTNSWAFTFRDAFCGGGRVLCCGSALRFSSPSCGGTMVICRVPWCSGAFKLTVSSSSGAGAMVSCANPPSTEGISPPSTPRSSSSPSSPPPPRGSMGCLRCSSHEITLGVGCKKRQGMPCAGHKGPGLDAREGKPTSKGQINVHCIHCTLYMQRDAIGWKQD